MMRFDLSAIPADATITKAKFGAYYWYPLTEGDLFSGSVVYVAPASDNWDESTVTWNTAPAAGSSITSVFYPPGPSQVGWHEVSDLALANWVQSALANPAIAENGWRLFVNGSNNGVHLNSREADYDRPFLYVEYIRSNTSTITLHPTGDATLTMHAWNTGWETRGSDNTRSSTWVDGYGGGCDSIMKWDLSAIPAWATVTNATFGWFYYYPETDGYGDTGRQCWFYQASGPWSENTVTWNNAPAKGDYLFNNSVYPGYGSWRTTVSDLTNADPSDDGLANWISAALASPLLAAHGWRISGPSDSNTGVTMYSREQTGYAPYLTVSYVGY